MTARSYLYVPGDRPDRFGKAAEAGADAIILDLEDAVGPAAKDAARQTVSVWMRDHAPGVGPEVWVRVNADDRLELDVASVVSPGLLGVVLPKATPALLERLHDALAAVEGTSPVAIVPVVETADGVLRARAIASASHVVHLALGEADLCAELGIEPSSDARELWSVRMQIVLASAAAGVEPPVGPVSPDFTDLEALRTSTEALRRMGFEGRSAIHPSQIGVINDVFTPSPDAVERARRVIERFDAAGGGACVDDNGRMIDVAVVRASRRVLARAQPG
jgi:citrate lyase subunit beta/citryl-CoA lyase